MEQVSYVAAGINGLLALGVVLKWPPSRPGAFALGVAAALGVALIFAV